MKNEISVQDVCDLLNELLKLDRQCIQSLVSHRVKCNDAIENHPTVQVQKYPSEEFAKLGVVGLLNGLFGINEDGRGAICFEIEDGSILRFKRTGLNNGR